MLKVALIFPGQGAQFVGMGKEFYESSPEAQAVIDEADGILGNGLKDVMLTGPAEKLTATAYCQPAILTMSVAALKAFEAHERFADFQVAFTAGLSLGEYGALVASGAMSFADTLRLVERRSAFMEEATQVSRGAMAAIIGLDREAIAAVCEQTGAEVANFNSPQQIVITGHADKVAAASEKLKAAGAKNVIALDVSGAFHSTLMQPAADKFRKTLEGVTIQAPAVPVISNVDAVPTTDPEKIRANLAAQITSSVRWVDTVEYIASRGVTTFVEIGPGKVLKGLIRRTDKNLTVHNVETPADIATVTAGEPV